MIETPKFKSHLRVECLPPDVLFILKEDGHQAFQGEFIYRVASFIDGRTTRSEIIQRVKGRMSESDVEALLLFFEGEGLIVDAGEAPPPVVESLCDYLQVDTRAAVRRLARSRVSVMSVGNISAGAIVPFLTDLGVQICEEGNFALMLVDDYLNPAIERFHRSAMRNKQKWMIAKPAGIIFWIGPAFEPGHACWKCLALRLKENRRAEAFVETNAGRQSIVRPDAARCSPVSWNLIAVEVFKHLIRHDKAPNLITFDLKEMRLERHGVVRLEHCPDCGSAKKNRKRFILNPGGKHYAFDPDHTFSKYEHHISPITGIVDRIVPYGTTDSALVHSYIASHIFLPRLKTEDVFRRGFVQQSGGKGLTAQQAKTSALCEALERYSGVFRGNESRKTAAALDLGDGAILPNACMNFSERQYTIREEWNRSHHAHDWVPVPFDLRRKIEWSPVWSLTERKQKYVPTAYCYYGYSLPADHQFCRADSNGNAAGNTMEQAIVHGFLELVERDATAIWWFNRLNRPGVELGSFEIPYVDELAKYYRKIGRQFWVLDTTADFPIASFVAISNAVKPDDRQFLVGFGAHFDPAVALLHAITEMNQFLPGIESGNFNGILQPAGKDLSYMFPDPKIPLRKRCDLPARDSHDFRDDINICVQLAAKRGLEALVLDQTRSDVGIPVLKVIVPGLRQFWLRLAKGRLYDVPVKLGWLKRPRIEIQLNQERIVI